MDTTISSSSVAVPSNNQLSSIERKHRYRMMMRIEDIGVDPEKINRRLKQIENEWDVERIMMTQGAFLSVWGLVMGVTRGRAWFALPIGVGALFFKHAVQGQGGVSDALQRWGFRTRHEIDEERMILKALRGDFQRLPDMTILETLEAARK